MGNVTFANTPADSALGNQGIYLSGTYALEVASSIQAVGGNQERIDTNLNAGLDLLEGGNPLTDPLLTTQYPNAQSPGPAGPTTIAAHSTAVYSLNVPDNFVIQQSLGQPIQVRLNITYFQTSDLQADLIAPDGTTVRLFSNVGPVNPTAGNFVNTLFADNATTNIENAVPQFDNGPYTPQFPLSKLIGHNVAGHVAAGRLEQRRRHRVDQLPAAAPAQIALSGTGLGEPVADKIDIGFHLYNLNPTDPTPGPVDAGRPDAGASLGYAGRATAMAVDPSDPSGNTVYVGGASGGIWKTTNFLTTAPAGPTWIPLTDFGRRRQPGHLVDRRLPAEQRPEPVDRVRPDGQRGQGTPSNPTGTRPAWASSRSLDGGGRGPCSTARPTSDGSGNVLPIGSSSRDRVFVGATGFKLIADPTLNTLAPNANKVILYMAVSAAPARPQPRRPPRRASGGPSTAATRGSGSSPGRPPTWPSPREPRGPTATSRCCTRPWPRIRRSMPSSPPPGCG